MMKTIKCFEITNANSASAFAHPTYAVLDIGSNSVRMVLCGKDQDDKILKINMPRRLSQSCKLGEGLSDRHRVIKEDNIRDAEQTLAEFDGLLRYFKIPEHNICALATAATRLVKGTKHGDVVYSRLSHALGGRRIHILTGEEESLLIGTGVKEALAKDNFSQEIAYINTGGSSTEVGIIAKSGDITHAVEFALGSHSLKDINDGNNGAIGATGAIYNEVLSRAWKGAGKCDILYAVGGNMEAIANITRDDMQDQKSKHGKTKNIILAGQDSIERLHSFASLPENFFTKHTDIGDRAPYMPVLMESLYQTANHVGATEIHFIDVRMAFTAAKIMHDYTIGKRPIPPGLEQPFALLTQALTPRA